MVTCALIGGTIFAQRDILMISVMVIRIGNVVKVVIELVKLKRPKIKKEIKNVRKLAVSSQP